MYFTGEFVGLTYCFAGMHGDTLYEVLTETLTGYYKETNELLARLNDEKAEEIGRLLELLESAQEDLAVVRNQDAYNVETLNRAMDERESYLMTIQYLRDNGDRHVHHLLHEAEEFVERVQGFDFPYQNSPDDMFDNELEI